MSIFEFSYTKLPLDIWFSFTDAVGGKETDLYRRTWCAFVSLCAHVDNLIMSLDYSWKGNGTVCRALASLIPGMHLEDNFLSA